MKCHVTCFQRFKNMSEILVKIHFSNGIFIAFIDSAFFEVANYQIF